MSWIKLENSSTPPSGGITENPLTGKIWNVSGDSLTANLPLHSSKNYHDYIKEWDGLSLVRNYGSSGSTIASTYGPLSYYYTTYDTNADYMTLFAGINDFGKNTPLGTFSDTTNATFYGACHVIFKGLLKMYAGKKVGYIAPHYQTQFYSETNALGLNLEQYVNAAIEVARYYAIPTLDLYHEGTISVRIAEQKTLYTGDGLHFNEAGHERIAGQIRNFLKSL